MSKATTARVPEGRSVYAVGDIHGRLDLLDELHGLIQEDAEAAAAQERVLIYLGDYVDRGPDSAGVIERLVQEPLPGFKLVHLKGNHEDFMLQFLERPEVGPHWLYNGGDATLASYGVVPEGPYAGPAAFDALRERFEAVLPEAHRDFLAGLSLSHREGDYLFVHAGIRPGVALERQTPYDMMWIRDEFLEFDGALGPVVVHGHTPAPAVQERPHRIGIDTAAFATGCLTCLVLEGAERALLQTAAA